MLPLGHLASALITSDRLKGDPLAAALGSQIPDLVDKPLAWVLKATASSRYLAHNIPATALTSLVAYRLGGPAAGRGILAGHLSHLLADQALGGRIPFLWPFKRYEMAHGKFKLHWPSLMIEVIAGYYLWRRLEGDCTEDSGSPTERSRLTAT